MSSLNWAQGFEHIFTGESASYLTSTYSHEDFDDDDLSGTDELDDVLLEDGYDDEDLLIDDDVDVVSNAVVGMESLTDVLSRHQLVGGMSATSARIFNKSMGHVMRDMPKHTYNYCASAVSFESGDSKSTNTNETKRSLVGKVKDFVVKMWNTIKESIKSFFKWIYDNTLGKLLNFFKKKKPDEKVQVPKGLGEVVDKVVKTADETAKKVHTGVVQPPEESDAELKKQVKTIVRNALTQTVNTSGGKYDYDIVTARIAADYVKKLAEASKRMEEAAKKAPVLLLTLDGNKADAGAVRALGAEVSAVKSVIKDVTTVIVKSAKKSNGKKLVPEGSQQLRLVYNFLNDCEHNGFEWGDKKSRDVLKHESQTQTAEVFMPKFEKIKAVYKTRYDAWVKRGGSDYLTADKKAEHAKIDSFFKNHKFQGMTKFQIGNEITKVHNLLARKRPEDFDSWFADIKKSYER